MTLLSRLVDTDSLLVTDRTDNGTIESAIIDIFLAYNLGLFGSSNTAHEQFNIEALNILDWGTDSSPLLPVASWSPPVVITLSVARICTASTRQEPSGPPDAVPGSFSNRTRLQRGDQ